MPLKYNLIEQKFTNITRNNSFSFAQNILRANVGERIKCYFKIELYSFLEPQGFEIYDYGGRIVLTNSTENFKEAGFSVGDNFEIRFGYWNNGVNETKIGTIIAMSEDFKTIFTNLQTFDPLQQSSYKFNDNNTATDVQCLITNITNLTNIDYKYNFVDSESIIEDFRSVNTEELQIYTVNVPAFATNINSNRFRDSRDTLYINSLPLASIPVFRKENFGAQNGEVPAFNRIFTIEHELTVPYFENGQIGNFTSKTSPYKLKEDNTLKYIFECKFKRSRNDIDSLKIALFNTRKDSIGWFNENFDKGTSNYEFISVEYKEDVTNKVIDSLSLDVVTKVKVRVKSNNSTFNFAQNFTVYHSSLNEDIEIDKNKYFNELFQYDFCNKGNSSLIIKNVTSTIVSTSLMDIDFHVDLTTKTNISNELQYFISIALENDAVTLNLSDRVNLLIDTNYYSQNTDVNGLLTNFSNEYFLEDIDLINDDEESVTDFRGWVQDVFGMHSIFTMPIDNTYMKSGSLNVVAYNETEDKYFKLQTYNFNLLEKTNQKDILLFLESNKQFQDDYLYLNCKSVTYKPTLGTSFVDVDFKIRFDWREWIAKEGIDEVFIDNLEPNNNLNLNISNFSLKEGYALKLMYEFNLGLLNDNKTTKYLTFVDVEVNDFKENANQFDSDLWELVSIKAFDSSDTDLNNILLQNDNLRIEAILRNTTSPEFVLDKFFGILRIEEFNVDGEFKTYQKSSIENALFNDDYTIFENEVIDIEKIDDTIKLTGYIKRNKLNKNVGRYNIYARIGLKKGYETYLGEFVKYEFNNYFNL